MNAKSYEKKLNQLFHAAKENKIQASFPHGIISTYHKGVCAESKLFLEVLPGSVDAVQKLNEGNYLCFQEPREIHSDPLSIFPPKLFDKETTTVIISCMSPTTYKYDKVVLEFQIQA
jgi:MerR family transcriptional regulator, activator of bmr gene